MSSEQLTREALPIGTRALLELLAKAMKAGRGECRLAFVLVDGRVRRWFVNHVEKGGALDLDRFDEPAR